MGPSSYNNSPCPAWLPQHMDPETQGVNWAQTLGSFFLLPTPFTTAHPKAWPLQPCLLPPFPLPGLFIGPGSWGLQDKRSQSSGLLLTGPSPGAPQPGQCLLSVQQSKRPVTQSDQ